VKRSITVNGSCFKEIWKINPRTTLIQKIYTIECKKVFKMSWLCKSLTGSFSRASFASMLLQRMVVLWKNRKLISTCPEHSNSLRRAIWHWHIVSVRGSYRWPILIEIIKMENFSKYWHGHLIDSRPRRSQDSFINQSIIITYRIKRILRSY